MVESGFLFSLGLVMGATGTILMNVGKAVQKRHAHILLHGREMFGPTHREDLRGWLIGACMTFSTFVPMTIALKLTESASLISALTGIGLMALVAYAVVVLKERINLRDAVGILVISTGTSVLGYMGKPAVASVKNFSLTWLIIALVLLLLPGIAGCVVASRRNKLHGVAFGCLAGMLIGVAMFFGDVGLHTAGGSILGQLWTPYPYLAVLSGNFAFAVTQMGFFRGRALDVVPTINSALILSPIFLEILVYGIFPGFGRFGMVLVIIAGVYLLSTGTAGRVAADATRQDEIPEDDYEHADAASS